MTPARVGVAIDGDCIVACARLRAGTGPVVAVERDPAESLGQAFVRAVAMVSGRRRGVAVGVLVLDGRVRSGVLFDLAGVLTATEVARLLRREPTAFFLGASDSLRGGNVWTSEAGWCGVVAECAVVDDLMRHAALHGITLLGIGQPAEPLAASDAAVRALEMRPDAPHVVDASRDEREANTVSRRRVAIAVVTAALLVWGLGAPGWSLLRERAQHEAREARLRVERDSLRAALAVHAVSPALYLALGEWVPARATVRAVLIALVDALPDSTALLSIRIDEGTGAVQLVAADAAAAVARLSTIPALRGLRIVGAITAEPADGRRLERVSASWDRPETTDSRRRD